MNHKFFKTLTLVSIFCMCSTLVYEQSTSKNPKEISLPGVYTVQQINPPNHNEDIKYFTFDGGGEFTVYNNVCTLKTPSGESSWSLSGMEYWLDEHDNFHLIDNYTNETWVFKKK